MLRTIAIALVLSQTQHTAFAKAHKSVYASIIAIIHAHGGVDTRLVFVRSVLLLLWLTAMLR